ncbi:sulfotransferase [Terasakiella sp. A23]|uniref:tetratricopeptide repeat-containing sulfotransferase family protein n=1 Tax=Terasakiella sp. FCG-A23 TaxID=3080561 RepID=UPI002953C30F|nr:sulfotransferase [Terasakiella sp. A23]MDV7341706.1 sulfotransferase [Terasakiella sp. A23]
MQNPLLDIQNLLKSQQFDKAIKTARKLLKDSKFGPGAHQLSAHAYMGLQKQKEALTTLSKAAKKWPQDGAIRQNFAGLLFQQQKFKEAKREFEFLLKLKPDDSIFLSNLANCHLALDNMAKAEELAEKSITVANPHANGFNILGIIYLRQDKIDQAEEIFKKALSLNMLSLDLAFNTLQFCETHNQPEKALEIYESLPKAFQDNSQIQLQLSILKRRAKDFKTAKALILDALKTPDQLTPVQMKQCYFELGKNCDHLAESADSFAAFEHGNKIAQQLAANQNFASPYDTLKKMETLVLEGGNLEKSPHFVLGFPRSGTTLIEQVLSQNEDIQIFEETPVIAKVLSHAFDLAKKGKKLDRTTLQQMYFDLYQSEEGWDGTSTLMDRSAPNMLYYPFICQLFPTAKQIILLRHPMDVVFSCFMQDFAPSGLNMEFSDLGRTAKVYNQIMNGIYAKSPQDNPDILLLKYEQIVDDFDLATKALFSFMDLEWHEGLREFWKHSRTKKAIKTASYQQVVEPLYNAAVNRWERYNDKLAPYQNLLASHLKEQGYQS